MLSLASGAQRGHRSAPPPHSHAARARGGEAGFGHLRPSSGVRLAALGAAASCACGRRRHRLRPGPRRLALFAVPRPHTEDPEGLIDAAKRYIGLGSKVVQQLGPTSAEDLNRELASDFEFVAPYVGPLSKSAIIAATTGLDLGEGLPDFNARYHAFRLDKEIPRRVWCQMRVCGTHTGNLNFAGTCASPRTPPIRVESPPEAVSFTFNEAGKVREITTGYPVDRRCGTTGGLGGIFGILEGLGYPLPAPLTRTCAELLTPVFDIFGLREELKDDAVMKFTGVAAADALDDERLLALTEKLIESRLGLDDASLLRDDFALTTPHGGALRKDMYLRAASLGNVTDAFPDLDYKWRDLRVCPFDVNRVWYTSSPVGTHLADLRLPTAEVVQATGRRWISPPVCGSAQFDRDGRCTAITASYVMDRRLGNTSGLGGVLGLREAIGAPSPKAWLARTPSQLWGALSGGP